MGYKKSERENVVPSQMPINKVEEGKADSL